MQYSHFAKALILCVSASVSFTGVGNHMFTSSDVFLHWEQTTKSFVVVIPGPVIMIVSLLKLPLHLYSSVLGSGLVLVLQKVR